MLKIIRNPPLSGISRDIAMNVIGACVFYLARDWYYKTIPNNPGNNLWWSAFVPLFCSRFPQKLGLGIDMMVKGWIGAMLALTSLMFTILISYNLVFCIVAIFIDGFCVHILHVRDRTWLAFNVFHLMIYWGSLITSHYHMNEIGYRDWIWLRDLAYGYFIPVSIGSVISILCHIIFCPIRETDEIKRHMNQAAKQMITMFEQLRKQMEEVSKNTTDNELRSIGEYLRKEGTKLSEIREGYGNLVFEAYLETRWKFGAYGMNLEKKAANQSRVIMTVYVFCCDMDLRLNQLADSHSDHESFCLPDHINMLLKSTKDLIIEYANSESARDTLADNIESELYKNFKESLHSYIASCGENAIFSPTNRLMMTLLHSLQNIVAALSQQDLLFLGAECAELRESSIKSRTFFIDWKRSTQYLYHHVVFSWNSNSFRSSIQQGSGMVLLTVILIYMYGADAEYTPGSFAVNTYCSVLRQVFVGWASVRVLVRCSGFFLAWIFAGIIYAIASRIDSDTPVTTAFFIAHMILLLFFLSRKYRLIEAIFSRSLQTIRDTGEGDPHMYYAYSSLVGWIVIANGWYGSYPETITLHMISDDIWKELFRDLVCQALIASAIALFILSVLFPSFASHYLRQQLGTTLDYFTTWFSVTNGLDPSYKLNDHHKFALLEIARYSDLSLTNLQRNTANSLRVEMWFQAKWAGVFSNKRQEKKYKELHFNAGLQLQALRIARRIWVSLWELTPIGPEGSRFGLPSSHFHLHSELNIDIIVAFSMLSKAYFGAPYESQYRFALPARLPQTHSEPRSEESNQKYSTETSDLTALIVEGSMIRLGNALHDWISLVNKMCVMPIDLWPCLMTVKINIKATLKKGSLVM